MRQKKSCAEYEPGTCPCCYPGNMSPAAIKAARRAPVCITDERRAALVARLDKRIERVSKNLAHYRSILSEARRTGQHTSRAGLIAVSTRMDAEDIAQAEADVKKWSQAVTDYQDIRAIVREAR